MARKRLPKRISESNRSSADSKTVTKSTETIGNDVSSSVKVTLLVIIGICIVGFLFYPDISRIIDSFKKTKNEPAEHGSKYDMDNVGKPDFKNVPTKNKPKIQEDLMEDESDIGEDSEVTVDVSEEDSNVEDDEELVKEMAKEASNKKRNQAPKTSDQDYIKLEPGKTETIHIQKADDSSTRSSKPKLKIKSSDKQKPSDKQKLKSSDGNATEADTAQQNLPDDIKKFKAQYQKTITAKKIFSGGRRIPPVELLHQKETNSSVKVFLFDDFLSPEECDGLRDAHNRHVQETSKQPPLLCFDSASTLRKHLKDAKKNIKITPNVFTEGTTCVNASFSSQLSRWLHANWSYSTAFYPGENKFSLAFAHRVQQAMGLAPENGGKLQLTSYPVGKAYKTHTDCIVDGVDKRDRVASVLVYLSDVKKGGETRFPDLGIWVKPRKGRALVWNNMDENGKCDPLSAHVASKVDEGQKYILIRWYYYKSFYSLGKRPPEPDLPPRAPGSPKVSCDEYEMGSCRWYDEWNYDHLLEYERKKLTLI
ncbi:uncharacterized protein LOC121380772 [Gigantopelta aegis]|uniref:uncharacterized protein LOC121380772 n=1 Tax=Gigantopelta aegis TaxID=1735272 RepID=UPI001B88BD6A|nr:uncharacterized protein LOC121380772 [Gigantopelta aegis]